LSENSISPPERPPSAEAPERIGKYDIVRPLGKGAMGVVYHAHDSLLDRDVALKVMLRQFAADPEQKHRFEREARAVAKLMHPNVVLVFDLGYHTDRSPYIAMELLKGQDLLQALRLGIPLPLDRKVSIILQVLDGLAHAHQTGIVHRDIKPANIFICEDGTVKIMDFGVARFTAASVTATGIVLGTANYMSPEQVEGAKVDGRSDVFSVASVLFELVVGRKPFQADSLMKTLYKIAHDEPSYTLPEGAENEALLPILQKALAKKVEERYQSAADFAFALREYLMTAGASAASAAVATPPAEAVGTDPHTREPTIDLSLRAAPMVAPEPAAPSKPSADPTALFKLMREIYLGRKSGHLHFAHGKERRSLLIHAGHILHGTSDVLGEHLGDVLVRYGLLEQPELNQATKIVLKDRKRLGAVLAEQGLMDTDRLSNAVSLHVREILFNVAERGDGSYAFEDTATDEGDSAASKLSTLEMILETARRVQDPGVVSHVLGDLDRVLVTSDNPELRTQNIALTPKEGFVMSRIDGTLTAREVFTIIPLPPEDTERSLFVLLCTGSVEYRTAGARDAPGSGARAARAAAAAAAAPSARPAASTVPTAPPPAAAPPRPAATAPPLAAAARPAAPAPAPVKKESDAIQGRQLLEARRQLIVNAHEAMAAKNHFEFLGVPRAATEAQVKEAYFRLARPLHPDSNRDPGLADLQDKREAAFHRLSQAYETLRDPQKRGRYEADLDARAPRRRPEPTAPQAPAPGPSVRTEADRVTEAALAMESVRQAEKAFKEEKYWDAIQLLEPAIPRLERNSKVKAQVLLARAYMKNPNWGRRAEELLQRVVQENPDQADAFVALGNLYRASQLKSRAQAMYRKAVQAQPGHQEALAELAALDGEGPPEGGTRLKKFFSKS
jgi:serine/threonine protein kinase/tetratricopeptide (TPR) repeat protein